MRKFILIVTVVLTSILSNAIEITRYVAEGATGDGLSKETPAGNLKKILDLSKNVDRLTVFLEPGRYSLPPLTDVNNRTQYRNVCLYGGGCEEAKYADNKSVIEGDLFINGGAVVNIDFKGSKVSDQWSPNVLEGTLKVIGCNVLFTDATSFEAEAVNGQTLYLIDVYAKFASIHAYRTGLGKPRVEAWGCNFCDGDGAFFGGVVVYATKCSFSNNNGNAGVTLNKCEGSVLTNCKILGNKGKGGVDIIDLTDDIDIYFDRCILSGNVTSDPKFSSAITTKSPIFMRNCLISNNRSNVKNVAYMDAYSGAIELNRRQSRFYNCTFFNNWDAVVYYNIASADHNNISSPQFQNCVFLNNDKPYANNSRLEPTMTYCAADFGSDIPELDAERNMIRITKENAGMTIEDGISVKLSAGSPLINAGLLDFNLDLYNNSHQMLGGTDLGCVEYCGEWVKSTPESELTIYGDKYIKSNTIYKDSKYYAFVPASLIDNDKSTDIKGAIYGGNELSPVKKVGDGATLASFISGNNKVAVLSVYNYSPWGSFGTWNVQDVKVFTTQPPIAEYLNNRWILKDAKPAAVKKSSTTTRPARKH